MRQFSAGNQWLALAERWLLEGGTGGKHQCRNPDERKRYPGAVSERFPDVAEPVIGRAFARPVGSSGLRSFPSWPGMTK
jgi:hypothetical protein